MKTFLYDHNSGVTESCKHKDVSMVRRTGDSCGISMVPIELSAIYPVNIVKSHGNDQWHEDEFRRPDLQCVNTNAFATM